MFRSSGGVTIYKSLHMPSSFRNILGSMTNMNLLLNRRSFVIAGAAILSSTPAIVESRAGMHIDA
jgi:hypothetical protein